MFSKVQDNSLFKTRRYQVTKSIILSLKFAWRIPKRRLFNENQAEISQEQQTFLCWYSGKLTLKVIEGILIETGDRLMSFDFYSSSDYYQIPTNCKNIFKEL